MIGPMLGLRILSGGSTSFEVRDRVPVSGYRWLPGARYGRASLDAGEGKTRSSTGFWSFQLSKYEESCFAPRVLHYPPPTDSGVGQDCPDVVTVSLTSLPLHLCFDHS